MKKRLLFLLTTILSLNGYAQISFEKGYFIDTNNQKTNCLIKNVDWKNNPTEFEYKLFEEDEAKNGIIKSVNEFGIANFSKYIRATVNIDRSKGNISDLSYNRNPIFKEEAVFLKVLVEGKSNLYEYSDGKVKRFFYTTANSNIDQLIFKNYKTAEDKIATNNRFRQQIWDNLKCPNFKMSKINSVDYFKEDLVRIFTEYSECHDYDLINFESKQKGDLFNLNIRPRLNSSSLAVQNAVLFPGVIMDFDNKIGVGFGLEAEFVLPFNKNKWAIVFEPTYQSFKSEGIVTNVSTLFGGELRTKIDYASIEIPLGLRHYLFLDSNSKIFINASVVFDINLKSSFSGTLFNGSAGFEPLEKAKSTENFAFGIGYKLYDRYILEIRYQTSRKILGTNQTSNWISDYTTFSVIFGYSLF